MGGLEANIFNKALLLVLNFGLYQIMKLIVKSFTTNLPERPQLVGNTLLKTHLRTSKWLIRVRAVVSSKLSLAARS